ncbi:hypothetical protein X975_08937, partial [Stegodyphus mimosarum]
MYYNGHILEEICAEYFIIWRLFQRTLRTKLLEFCTFHSLSTLILASYSLLFLGYKHGILAKWGCFRNRLLAKFRICLHQKRVHVHQNMVILTSV